jgi:hypothetical protein
LEEEGLGDVAVTLSIADALEILELGVEGMKPPIATLTTPTLLRRGVDFEDLRGLRGRGAMEFEPAVVTELL